MTFTALACNAILIMAHAVVSCSMGNRDLALSIISQMDLHGTLSQWIGVEVMFDLRYLDCGYTTQAHTGTCARLAPLCMTWINTKFWTKSDLQAVDGRRHDSR